jgi:hypothetical protein
MTEPPIDSTPGYRRRIRVEPDHGAVLAMLEDDLHCLGVVLRHDGTIVTAVEPLTPRMPWTTCPGAAAKLVETFEGQALAQVTARRDKKANCTHLHDMAVLAAAHAADTAPITYDILATDPVGGERRLDICRDGALIHSWIERHGVLAEPPPVAGMAIPAMRDWINGLSGIEQEAARLLQWGSLVAHGRTMPLEQQSRATDLPPNCYTFQPERAVHAVRVGLRHDFSDGSRVPLAEFGASMRASV